MIKLLYICQQGEAERVMPRLYEDFTDGRDDADWFGTRLEELALAERVSLTKVRVCQGQAIPRDQSFDAAVLGGSDHMVAERRPWQLAIADWLKHWRAGQKPLLGICGGHQLMGLDAGVQVSPLPGGTWTATKRVCPNLAAREHWLFRDLRDGVDLHFGNSQHLASVPASATVLAAVEDSPGVVLDYGGGWVGVQGHPEMTVAVFARYLRDKGLAEQLENYRDSPTAPLILRNFIDFVSARA